MSAASAKTPEWIYLWVMIVLFSVLVFVALDKLPITNALGTAPVLGTTSNVSIYQDRTIPQVLFGRSSIIRVQVRHGSEIGGRYNHHFHGKGYGRRATFDGHPLELVEKEGIPYVRIPVEFPDGPAGLRVAIGPKRE